MIKKLTALILALTLLAAAAAAEESDTVEIPSRILSVLDLAWELAEQWFDEIEDPDWQVGLTDDGEPAGLLGLRRDADGQPVLEIGGTGTSLAVCAEGLYVNEGGESWRADWITLASAALVACDLPAIPMESPEEDVDLALSVLGEAWEAAAVEPNVVRTDSAVTIRVKPLLDAFAEEISAAILRHEPELTPVLRRWRAWLSRADLPFDAEGLAGHLAGSIARMEAETKLPADLTCTLTQQVERETLRLTAALISAEANVSAAFTLQLGPRSYLRTFVLDRGVVTDRVLFDTDDFAWLYGKIAARVTALLQRTATYRQDRYGIDYEYSITLTGADLADLFGALADDLQTDRTRLGGILDRYAWLFDDGSGTPVLPTADDLISTLRMAGYMLRQALPGTALSAGIRSDAEAGRIWADLGGLYGFDFIASEGGGSLKLVSEGSEVLSLQLALGDAQTLSGQIGGTPLTVTVTPEGTDAAAIAGSIGEVPLAGRWEAEGEGWRLHTDIGPAPDSEAAAFIDAAWDGEALRAAMIEESGPERAVVDLKLAAEDFSILARRSDLAEPLLDVRWTPGSLYCMSLAAGAKVRVTDVTEEGGEYLNRLRVEVSLYTWDPQTDGPAWREPVVTGIATREIPGGYETVLTEAEGHVFTLRTLFEPDFWMPDPDAAPADEARVLRLFGVPAPEPTVTP